MMTNIFYLQTMQGPLMFLKSHGLLGPNGWSSFFKITYLQMVPNDGRLLHLYSIYQQLMFFVIFFSDKTSADFP